MQGYFVYLKPQLKPIFKPIRASLSDNENLPYFQKNNDDNIQNVIVTFITFYLEFLHKFHNVQTHPIPIPKMFWSILHILPC